LSCQTQSVICHAVTTALNAMKIALGNSSLSTQTDIASVNSLTSHSSLAIICCGSSIARTFCISLGLGASTIAVQLATGFARLISAPPSVPHTGLVTATHLAG